MPALSLRFTSRPRWALLVVLILASTGRGQPLAELPGPLVIAHGKEPPADIRDEFIQLAGKGKARVVVVAAADDAVKPWKAATLASAVFVKIPDRTAADDTAILKPLADATGVWVETTYPGTRLEKELQRLHARGVAIGGDVGSFLPGFTIDQRNRLPQAVTANPQRVGLALVGSVAVVARGRHLIVAGDGALTIHIAAGAGKPAATQVAKAGALFDLFQLRRAAMNRASKDPFPPAKPKDPVVEKGTLIIIGGGGSTPEMWKRFIALAGGPDALIVVIPTSMEDPLPAEPVGERILKKFGAKNVKSLHTRDRKQADDPKFSEMLLKAGGVWFGGGRQWRFVDSYEGTLTQKRIRSVLDRGGVIGGSSAGASIQSEFMPRGHPLGNTVMAAEGYERGFGYLPGAAVDQHFFARKRTADMTGLMKQYPQYLGIGIDESTAIVVTGSTAEVIGKSKVAFYDTRKKPDGEKDYVEVKAGEKYNLKTRQKLK